MSEILAEKGYAPIPADAAEPSFGERLALFVFPREAVLYALIFGLALALRLFALDGPPAMSEVPNLLAALRGGESASPALFWAQGVGMQLLGGDEFAGRFLTALAGVALTLSPLLFRVALGRTRTLALVLLLTVSAPLVITAREAAPVVWTSLFAVITVWLWSNHFNAPAASRGTAAVVATGALIFLGDSSGVVFALAIAAGGALALLWGAAVADSDAEAGLRLADIRAAVGLIAWDRALLLAALVILVVATGFMTFPSGFSTIGGLLSGIPALVQPDGENIFGISLFYQTLLWGMAIASLLLGRREGFNGADRFFIGWLLVALLASILLPGLSAQHSVLFVFPLSGLISRAVAYAFAPDRRQQILSEQYSADGDELAMLMSPPAGRFILGILIFALLFIFNVHLAGTAREVLSVGGGDPASLIQRMSEGAASAHFRVGLLWSFISAMFLLIGYFLAGSIWGSRVAVQGYLLGFLAMALVSQLSGGWYASAAAADDPIEPWHHEAVNAGYVMMEGTLSDLTFRSTRGFPLLPITVIRDPASGVTEDGLLGWLLRDFARINWVDSYVEAASAPIIIAPDSYRGVEGAADPQLGGSYVGQSFLLTTRWERSSMTGWDFLTWHSQRLVRVQPFAGQAVLMWVRQDVFENLPVQRLMD